METKKCSKCQQTKDIINYNKDKSRKDGYSCRCKPCNAEKARAFRANRISILTRTCTMCNVKKRNRHFYRDSSRTSGLHARCKDCFNKQRLIAEENAVLGIKKVKTEGNSKWASLDLPKKKCACDLHSYLWQRANPCTHSEVWDAVTI